MITRGTRCAIIADTAKTTRSTTHACTAYDQGDMCCMYTRGDVSESKRQAKFVPQSADTDSGNPDKPRGGTCTLINRLRSMPSTPGMASMVNDEDPARARFSDQLNEGGHATSTLAIK